MANDKPGFLIKKKVRPTVPSAPPKSASQGTQLKDPTELKVKGGLPAQIRARQENIRRK